MLIRVELNGALCRLAGTQSLTLELTADATVADALAVVEQRIPDAAERLEATACAIGDQLVPRTAVLDGDEPLVLIPPVSGG